MTIHSVVQYECKNCGTSFVPIPEAPECPKCLSKSDTVSRNFVKATIDSLEYNLCHYGLFVKTWLQLDIGNFYFFWAFRFLDFVSAELKVDGHYLLSRRLSQDQADSLASRFLEELRFEESASYWKQGLRPYLSLLLRRGPK